MILVTGATGLVGSHLLAKLLKTGQKVRALYRSEEKIHAAERTISRYFPEKKKGFSSEIDWFRSDLSNIPKLTEAFQGISKVYHCAGLISHDPADYQKLKKTNIEGTANIVNLCLKFQIEKLAYVSSIATLGKPLKGKKVTENNYFEHNGKHSVYAITKFGGEMEVWRASQEGLKVVIVNPGIIIGAGNWNRGSGRLFKKINRGLAFHLPKTTGFVSVEDTVGILVKLMEKPLENERFILVSENLSFKKVLFEIAKNLGKPLPKKKLKPWMVFCGWLLQWTGSKLLGKKRDLTHRSVKNLFEHTDYDNTKIKECLGDGFTPIAASIEKTARVFLREQATG